MKFYVLALLAFFQIILLTATFCWARVDIEPRLRIREEYNDNIFLEPSNEDSDFITTAFPGVRLVFDSNYLNLDLDYGLYFLFYADNTDRNETDPGDTQRARLFADILPGRDFNVTVLDEVSRVLIDERRETVDANPFVNRSNRNLLQVSPRYRLGFLKTFKATLGYQYEKIDYQSPVGDDSEGHRVYLDTAKDLLEGKMVVGLGGSGQTHDSETTEDFDRRDVYGSINYRLSKRLTLEGRAGFAWIDFEVDDNATSRTGRVGAEYRFSERLRTSGFYEEDISVSVTDGTFVGKRAVWSLGYQDRISADLTLSGSRNSFLNTDREDRSLGGSVTFEIPFGRRIALELHGDFFRLKFLPENEIPHRYGGGASLSWEIKNVQFAFGYNYRINDSNFDVNDYRNNIAFAEANVTF